MEDGQGRTWFREEDVYGCVVVLRELGLQVGMSGSIV